MSENKYQYLFDIDNNIVYYKDAIKGADYRLNTNESFDYTYNEGVERQYFTLKNKGNIFYISPPGGESAEHANAKLKIAHEKKYYDTIFKQWIEFNKVIPELYYEIKKRPDLSCYDQNNVLVCCIEICYSSQKTAEDIELLKNIKVPIIEIFIKDDNRCNHIIFTKVLESNRSKYTKLKQQYIETETEYDRFTEKFYPEANRIGSEVTLFEKNSKREFNNRIEKINIWLQKRLSYKIGSIDFKSEIRKLEIKLSKTNQSITVTEYQIGKQENQFNSVTEELRSTTDTFTQIANSCKIEWFRNDWIAYKPQNLIQEIKYWLN